MRIISLALITTLGLSVSACDSTTANRSVYSERQPVVSKSNFVLDLNAGNGGLSTTEQNRLAGWNLATGIAFRSTIQDILQALRRKQPLKILSHATAC